MHAYIRITKPDKLFTYMIIKGYTNRTQKIHPII